MLCCRDFRLDKTCKLRLSRLYLLSCIICTFIKGGESKRLLGFAVIRLILIRTSNKAIILAYVYNRVYFIVFFTEWLLDIAVVCGVVSRCNNEGDCYCCTTAQLNPGC